MGIDWSGLPDGWDGPEIRAWDAEASPLRYWYVGGCDCQVIESALFDPKTADATTQAERLILAARALAGEPLVTGWLPIEHYDPKQHGERVDIFVHGGGRFCNCIRSKMPMGVWWFSLASNSFVGGQPTHFMPIPPAPEAAQ